MAIVARTRGVSVAKVAKPPAMPPEGAHIWQAFRSLHSARVNNGFGPCPISFVDMDAWQRVMQYPLAPWEAEAVRKLDDAYLAIDAEKAEERPTKGDAL